MSNGKNNNSDFQQAGRSCFAHLTDTLETGENIK